MVAGLGFCRYNVELRRAQISVAFLSILPLAEIVLAFLVLPLRVVCMVRAFWVRGLFTSRRCKLSASKDCTIWGSILGSPNILEATIFIATKKLNYGGPPKGGPNFGNPKHSKPYRTPIKPLYHLYYHLF